MVPNTLIGVGPFKLGVDFTGSFGGNEVSLCFFTESIYLARYELINGDIEVETFQIGTDFGFINMIDPTENTSCYIGRAYPKQMVQYDTPEEGRSLPKTRTNKKNKFGKQPLIAGIAAQYGTVVDYFTENIWDSTFTTIDPFYGITAKVCGVKDQKSSEPQLFDIEQFVNNNGPYNPFLFNPFGFLYTDDNVLAKLNKIPLLFDINVNKGRAYKVSSVEEANIAINTLYLSQDDPKKPIDIIIFASGGGNDCVFGADSLHSENDFFGSKLETFIIDLHLGNVTKMVKTIMFWVSYAAKDYVIAHKGKIPGNGINTDHFLEIIRKHGFNIIAVPGEVGVSQKTLKDSATIVGYLVRNKYDPIFQMAKTTEQPEPLTLPPDILCDTTLEGFPTSRLDFKITTQEFTTPSDQGYKVKIGAVLKEKDPRIGLQTDTILTGTLAAYIWDEKGKIWELFPTPNPQTFDITVSDFERQVSKLYESKILYPGGNYFFMITYTGETCDERKRHNWVGPNATPIAVIAVPTSTFVAPPPPALPAPPIPPIQAVDTFLTLTSVTFTKYTPEKETIINEKVHNIYGHIKILGKFEWNKNPGLLRSDSNYAKAPPYGAVDLDIVSTSPGKSGAGIILTSIQQILEFVEDEATTKINTSEPKFFSNIEYTFLIDKQSTKTGGKNLLPPPTPRIFEVSIKYLGENKETVLYGSNDNDTRLQKSTSNKLQLSIT